MAWLFNCRSYHCSGTHQLIYPQETLLDALAAFRRHHEISGADILQWSEIDLQQAIKLKLFKWKDYRYKDGL